jgi:hypothetical protein
MSGSALPLATRSGSSPIGIGGVGKKVAIRSSAFSLSNLYVLPLATSSGTSIGALAGLA